MKLKKIIPFIFILSYQIHAYGNSSIRCLDQVNDYKNLSQENKLLLCMNAARKKAPIECYEKLLHHPDLSKIQKVILCGGDGQGSLLLEKLKKMNQKLKNMIKTTTLQ